MAVCTPQVFLGVCGESTWSCSVLQGSVFMFVTRWQEHLCSCHELFCAERLVTAFRPSQCVGPHPPRPAVTPRRGIAYLCHLTVISLRGKGEAFPWWLELSWPPRPGGLGTPGVLVLST